MLESSKMPTADDDDGDVNEGRREVFFYCAPSSTGHLEKAEK